MPELRMVAGVLVSCLLAAVLIRVPHYGDSSVWLLFPAWLVASGHLLRYLLGKGNIDA